MPQRGNIVTIMSPDESVGTSSTVVLGDLDAFDRLGPSSEFVAATASSTAEVRGAIREADVRCVVVVHDPAAADRTEAIGSLSVRYPSTPIVALVRDADPLTGMAVVAEGADEYVPAPAVEDVHAALVGRVADVRDAVVAGEWSVPADLFEAIGDPLLVHDAEDGRITAVNEAFRDMHGYDRGELLGTRVDRITATDRIDRDSEEMIRRATEQGAYTFDWVNRHRDGTEIPVEVTLSTFDYRGRELVLAVVRDVSEKYEHQRKLEREQAFLESIYASLPDLLYAFDENGQLLRWNDRVTEVTGYDDEAIAGMAALEFIAPADRPRVLDAIRDVIEDGTTRRIEADLLTADGETIPYEFTGSRMTTDDGERLGLLGIGRDLRERKEYEHRIERRSRALEAAIDGVAILDADGTYEYVNEAHAELYGYDDPAELVGASWRTLYDESELRRFDEEIMPTLYETGSWRGEAVGTRADGTTFDQELSLNTFDDGEIVCVVRDITDRKRRERRLEAVFNNTYQFTGLLRPDGTVVEVNETALSFGGIDRADVVDRTVCDAYWFRGRRESRDVAEEAVATAAGGDSFRTQLPLKGEVGTEVVDFSVRPVTDEDDAVQLLVLEGRSITQLEQREEHLEALHRFLRHNIRNQMTVIRGCAMEIVDGDDDRTEEQAAMVVEAADRLLDLTETARELSEVVLGDFEETVRNVTADLRRLVGAFETEYPRASVALEAEGSRYVRADDRFRMVIEELLQNAVEHAASDAPSVRLRVASTEDHVEVSVIDEGPVIPDEELRGVTNDVPPTEVAHGTGFGLKLVRAVVDDYGGSIEHAPRADGGNRLTIRLPAVSGADEE